MKSGLIAACATAAVGLGGCVIVAGNDGPDLRHERSEGFDRVLGAEVSVARQEVSIIARSNGCTTEGQFQPVVRDTDHGHFEVGFRRTVEDHCRALMPEGKRLVWSFAQLGVPESASVRVLNRVGD